MHSENINICFTTIQKLHSDLHSEKENALTFDDFENKKIVLLADEAHHGQAQTKQMDALDKKIENPSWDFPYSAENFFTKQGKYAFGIYCYNGFSNQENCVHLFLFVLARDALQS